MNLDIFKANRKLIDQNLQIIACAGAGKTDFISDRIVFIISEKIAKPENIVAFTFTERAAKELKFRIRKKIREYIGRQYDIGDMYIGTIHGFCYELLKEYSPMFRGFDVLDEKKRFAFVNSHRRELLFDELSDWLEQNADKPYGVTPRAWVINTFIRGIDITREEMSLPKNTSSCPVFTDAVEKYDEILLKHRFLDFSGMMSFAVQIFENEKSTLDLINHRFTHITVDEYQDINPIQEQLIQLLTGEKGNLCVVGDDDQSIYQWRGSKIENILTFKDRYSHVYRHYLPVNYRSTGDIVSLGNGLIQRNTKRLPKSMKDSGQVSEKGDIYKIRFERLSEETDFIVRKIRELLGTEWDDGNKKRGLTYSDMAVFFRSVRYEAKPYLEALDMAKIPYTVSGIGGLFETPEVDLLFSIFACLGDFEKELNENNNEREVPDEKHIINQAKALFNLPDERTFIKWLRKLKGEIKDQKRISLQGIYHDILNALHLLNLEHHDDAVEIRLYNLGRLSEAISDYETVRTYCTYRDIRRFCWFVRQYAEANYDSGAGDDPTRFMNAIQVVTLHGTKGLGFPAVFMPHCVERKPRETEPGFLNTKKFDFSRYHGSEEDERRLFYVGMTRAKKFLFITTSRDPGLRKRKKDPSGFFLELSDKGCIISPSIDPTPRKRLKPKALPEDYQFPTNYSELSAYLRCEYDYKLRYIFGFNPGIVQALGYGRQVHNVLNMLHKTAQEKSRIPSAKEAAKILRQHFYLRFAAKEQMNVFRKSAMRSVQRYLGMWREDFMLSVKSERPFEMDIENALLSGTIDLLKRGQTNESVLEVIDFKTGNEKKMSEELQMQVQLYTIAAREALGLRVEKAYVHFLDEKKQARVEILTTPKQLDLALRTISDSVTGVTTRRYRRNPRNIQHREKCDWHKICPKKKK